MNATPRLQLLDIAAYIVPGTAFLIFLITWSDYNFKLLHIGEKFDITSQVFARPVLGGLIAFSSAYVFGQVINILKSSLIAFYSLQVILVIALKRRRESNKYSAVEERYRKATDANQRRILKPILEEKKRFADGNLVKDRIELFISALDIMGYGLKSDFQEVLAFKADASGSLRRM
ncbi:MAG: hypothetical protein AAF108_03750 [Planctomycetota bacterium]